MVETRYRAWVLVGLLCVVSLGLWGVVTALPAAIYSPDWILGENGNQLFRADQLHAGKALYRDVDTQYGPVPIWLWYGFTLLAGNTIAANVLFQNLLVVLLVAVLFWWTTRDADRRSIVLAIALALGVLTFARTPYLYLIASPSTNLEYLTFERLCLVGLMMLWRPPDERSAKGAGGLALLFLAWQLSKVGGAIFGLAAFAVMDVVWLLTQRQRGPLRAWLRWWSLAVTGIVVLELLRCGLFVLAFGSEQGWRSAWPLHVTADYQRTWLTLWATPRHFVTVILPILALIAPVFWLVARASRGRWQLLIFQAAVGTAFYVIAATPQVGYFGHEWHFFQYQWVLLPLALAALHRWPWMGLAILLLVHAGSMNRLIKEVSQGPPAHELTRLDTPIGPILTLKDDARGMLLRQALTDVSAEPRPHSLIMSTWGGGGWYVAAQETRRPQNIFFSHGVIRRPQDNIEAATLLASTSLVLIQSRRAVDGRGASLEWVEAVAGPAFGRQLREEFTTVSSAESEGEPGWVLLRRR